MSTQFEGKKRLVIGGTSGMGLQTARMALSEGGYCSGGWAPYRLDRRSAQGTYGSRPSLGRGAANMTSKEGLATLLKTIDDVHDRGTPCPLTLAENLLHAAYTGTRFRCDGILTVVEVDRD